MNVNNQLLGIGKTKQIIASGTYVDGMTVDVTSKCGFQSSDEGVVTVPADMTEVPKVTYDAGDGLLVTVEPVAELPGVTTMTVSDSAGITIGE